MNAVKGLRNELGHVRLRTLRFLMRHLVRCIRMQHERKPTSTTTPAAAAAGASATPAASASSGTGASANAGNLTPTLAHRMPKTSTSSNYDAVTSPSGAAGGAGGAGAAGVKDMSLTQDLIGRLDPVVSSVLIRPPWHSLVRCAPLECFSLSNSSATLALPSVHFISITCS